MRPWEIARLTDHQILHGYVFPSQNRAEAAKRGGVVPPIDATGEDQSEPDEPPNRQQMLGVMVGLLGMKKEAAAAEYDRQLAAWARRKREGL